MDRSRPRICLAASGGGHIRQILDLEPFWGGHDAYIVTEPTALGDSLAKRHDVRFVPHFAFGQRKIGSWLTLLRSGAANFRASRRIDREMLPDIVISTGAGSALFTALLAKRRGARFILIESFARVRAPSLFGRMAKRFADRTIVQSAELATVWPDAEVCDPLKRLDGPRPEKQPLAFVTVGTVMPFDRLVDGVAALKRDGLLPERVIAQVGDGGHRPDGFECHERLEFDAVQDILQRADIVFTHAGTGSLVTALRAGCRTITMPRTAARKEHYDDHQQEIADAFADRGLARKIDGIEELPAALAAARAAEPRLATTEPDRLIAHLRQLMAQWFPAC
jgi:UDP-N-acetylglucosamine transferase subunit ALG13